MIAGQDRPGEWVQKLNGSCLTGRPVCHREITREICICRHVRLGQRLGLGCFQTLISGEEEQLVPNDSSAKRAAILVLVQRVLRSGEEVGRIDKVVADELKGCPMPLVRSGTRYNVDQTARMKATLSTQSRSLNAKLGDRIGEW